MQGPDSFAAKAWFHQYFFIRLLLPSCGDSQLFSMFLGGQISATLLTFVSYDRCSMYGILYLHKSPPKTTQFCGYICHTLSIWDPWDPWDPVSNHTLAGKDAKKRSRLNSALRPGVGRHVQPMMRSQGFVCLRPFSIHGPKSHIHVKVLTHEQL